MDRFDELWVWTDTALAASLGWYRDVAVNRKPAKFVIARTIPVELDLDGASEEALWSELDTLTPVFLETWQGIRDRGAPLGSPASGPSLLDLCRALTERMLAHCNFCQWNCAVDRRAGGKLGTCKLAADTRVSSYFHHPGEELVYRGNRGSGTIFFTSCNMRCAFCQNGDISTDKDNGEVVSAETLAAMAWLLRLEGCHNINWVGGDPTIHLHTIVAAIARLGDGREPPDRDRLRRALKTKADPFHDFNLVEGRALYDGRFNVPMLWNSNFFMTEETMKILRLLIDVWLPDFKFGPGRCATRLARTAWYWDTVTRNLKWLADWGEDFTIRHLVMPNHLDCCTYPVLDWIAEHMPTAPVNIMDQYHPDTFCDPRRRQYDPKYEDLSRRLKRDEILDAYGHADRLGLAYKAITHERSRLGLRF